MNWVWAYFAVAAVFLVSARLIAWVVRWATAVPNR